jgi:hypothetical protein
MDQYLYLNGFYFFDVDISSVVGYLSDRNNYKEFDMKQVKDKTNFREVENLTTINPLPPEIIKGLISSLPQELQDYANNFDIKSSANICYEGFEIPPHKDSFDDKEPYYDAVNVVANILFYITPEEFEGRDFVYGVTKTANIDEEDYYWGSPKLETLGQLTPQTGKGVVISTLNPKFWHAVTELIKGTVIRCHLLLY